MFYCWFFFFDIKYFACLYFVRVLGVGDFYIVRIYDGEYVIQLMIIIIITTDNVRFPGTSTLVRVYFILVRVYFIFAAV